ncbi:MAG: Holliday junction resolvase RuvX [Phototrophicaceae bacterium]
MIGRLLGIDHGLKRIGLAVSDAMGISARALMILDRQGDAPDYARIAQIIQQQQAVAVIVGLPSNEGNSEQADIVQAWVTGLRAVIPCPLLLWDEQLTSSDARGLARQQKRKPTAPIDDLAAQVILQSYLNALADGLAPSPTES